MLGSTVSAVRRTSGPRTRRTARADAEMKRGDEREKCRRYAPHSHALGWACTDRLAPETTGRVLAKTKTETFSLPLSSTPPPPSPHNPSPPPPLLSTSLPPWVWVWVWVSPFLGRRPLCPLTLVCTCMRPVPSPESQNLTQAAAA